MRIEIEIPKEFEVDYTGDKFKDFFSRVLCDIKEGKCLCGNYEIETVEMFLKAFDESKPAYSVEDVIKQIHNKFEGFVDEIIDNPDSVDKIDFLLKQNKEICKIVRNGGKE